MWPYPTVVLILPSLSSPFSAKRSRASSTSEYMSLTGMDKSYLYTRPSLPAASGSDSRRDHSDWTWVSSCARVPSEMVPFSSRDSSRPPSFWEQEKNEENRRSQRFESVPRLEWSSRSSPAHLVIVVLVAPARLDQDIERFLGPFLRLRLERRLSARVLEDHLEPFVVKELERRQDFAEVGARLFEDGLDGFKVGHREHCDVVGLSVRLVPPSSVSPLSSPPRRQNTCTGLTLGSRGVKMETPVTTPNVPSAPIKSCFKS